MPDILPVSLQDILHSRKPELRENEISSSERNRISYKQRYPSLLIIREDMAEAGRSFFTCGLRGRTEMDKRLFGDWRSESGPGQFL